MHAGINREAARMHIEIGRPFAGQMLDRLTAFLKMNGLDYDPAVGFTVMLMEDDEILATASLDGNTVKCVAVSPMHQGEGLTANLMTEIRQEAFSKGLHHLMLFTKPGNLMMFREFGFHPVMRTESVLLMENRRNGLDEFLKGLDRPESAKTVGCIVANCNPFTLGHRYLIETASKRVDALHVFILSESKSMFSPEDRMALAKAGCRDIDNVYFHPTGPYLVSSATFPTYFIKDKAKAGDIHCGLDVRIFGEKFVPALGVTHRFVGTEPNCQVTNAYNEQMKQHLPRYGVEVVEIPRREVSGEAVSASRVRALLAQGDFEGIRPLVPDGTYEFLVKKFRQ